MNKMKSIANSVALIGILNGEDQLLGTGTGACVSNKKNESYFITNNHVCKKALENKSHSVYGLTGEGDKSYIVTNLSFNLKFEIIDADKSLDLCLLKANSNTRPLTLAKSSKFLERFDELHTVGAPSSNFPILQKTNFSGFLDRTSLTGIEHMMESPNEYLFLSEIIHPGQSGSPVFNDKLEMVGLIFSSMVKSKRSMTYGGIAIPVEDIRRFLKKNKVI